MSKKPNLSSRVHDRAQAVGDLAAIVSARREELNLLQSDLAELAGCSIRFVHTVEAGKPTVRLDKLLDLLQVLGVHLQVERGRSGDGVVVGPRLAAVYDLPSSDRQLH